LIQGLACKLRTIVHADRLGQATLGAHPRQNLDHVPATEP
jgi:hypothetical protein